MNKTITGRDIRNQLKADLIGKDSYRGVTLTYTWLANQFGHISLGFIPTFILYIVLSRYYSNDSASIRAAAFISAAWFIFEAFNFLGPLLLSNPFKKKMPFRNLPSSTFSSQPGAMQHLIPLLTQGFSGLGHFSPVLFVTIHLLLLQYY